MAKKIPPWATNAVWIGAIVLIAVLLGQLTSTIITGKFNVPRKITVSQEEAVQNQETRSITSYQREIMPLFGTRKAPVKSGKNTRQNDRTDSNQAAEVSPWDRLLESNTGTVKLKGTLITSDVAVALLEVEGKDVALPIGETAGSYILDNVTKTTVTFRKGADTRMIAMELDSDAVAAIQQQNEELANRPQETIADNNSEEGEDMDNLISYNGDKRIVDRRGFDALLKPPSRLANDVKFIPNSKDGKPYGIRISYLKPDSFFTKIGLRAGDVLVKTNNKDIKTVEDSFYAYQAFKNEEHLVMEVDRNGQTIQIPLEFR